MKFHSIDLSQLDSKERAKIVKGSVLPRPIAWITTSNEDGSVNLAPFSYFNMLNSTTLAVSFMREAGRKDTARNLLRTGEAVIHIPDTSLIEAVDLSSKPLTAGASEVDLTGLSLVPSSVVEPPALAKARIRFEVRLLMHIELEESDLLLLEVLVAHLREDVYDAERNYVLHEKLDPLARLGGPYYSGISEIEDFERQF